MHTELDELLTNRLRLAYNDSEDLQLSEFFDNDARLALYINGHTYYDTGRTDDCGRAILARRRKSKKPKTLHTS